MTTTAKITWNAEDPATPALLDPLFDDMGLGKDDSARSERPEEKALAREALKNYCLTIIKASGSTMGELNVLGYVFYDGYLAGMASKAYPERS